MPIAAFHPIAATRALTTFATPSPTPPAAPHTITSGHENLRLNGNVTDIRGIAEARLERNGIVSVVRK